MGADVGALLGLDDDQQTREIHHDVRVVSDAVWTLVRARKAARLSQREVARRMETTQSAVAKFERTGGDPRLSTLQRYARAVGAQLHVNIRFDNMAWSEGTPVEFPITVTRTDQPVKCVVNG